MWLKNWDSEIEIDLKRTEKIVIKGENAGYQHFLFFPLCFPQASFTGFVKSRDCVGMDYELKQTS